MFHVAEYIHWAKKMQTTPPKLPLGWSNVPALTREELSAWGVDTTSPELAYGSIGHDGAGPLRQTVSARRKVPEERILIGVGTTGANFAVLAANLEGRTKPVALIEQPVYSPLVATLESLGYEIARFERPKEKGYALDPERVSKAWKKGTAVVLVTQLMNPTGAAASKEALLSVAKKCEKEGAILLSDEVYREFCEESVAPPAYPLSDAVVTTESGSKALGIAELRAGWAIGEPKLIARARRIQDHTIGELPSSTRALATRILAKWDNVVARARQIAGKNRALVERFLEKRDDIRWTAPAGGVHALFTLTGREKAADFQERLLKEEGVLVIPGRFFEAPDSFRIGWGGASEKVEEALAGIGRALDRNPKK